MKNIYFVFLATLAGASVAWADKDVAGGGHAAAAAANLAPEAALKALQDGNLRFSSGKSRHPSQTVDARKQLAKGQAPNAIVLSCSDSRVPPEIVFDQGLGEVFTVRVAGNVLDDDAIASIEYAVAHLGSRLIVVMGHESCGAVKAALTTPKGEGESASLKVLISEIQENLGAAGEASAKLAGDATLREPVKKNVSAVAAGLTKRSKIVKDAVDSGKVKVVPAIYGLGTGKVEFWD